MVSSAIHNSTTTGRILMLWGDPVFTAVISSDHIHKILKASKIWPLKMSIILINSSASSYNINIMKKSSQSRWKFFPPVFPSHFFAVHLIYIHNQCSKAIKTHICLIHKTLILLTEKPSYLHCYYKCNMSRT